MENIIRNPESLNVESFEFTKPKTNQSGGQSVFVNINGNKVRFQTPVLRMPFGVNDTNNRKSIDFSISDQNFEEFVKSVDNAIVQSAVNNSAVWFKRQLTEGVVSELYKKSMKPSEKYPPLMRMKLPTVDNEFTGEIYDSNKNELSMKSLQKGSRVQLIAEIAGIYFVAKEFGISWKIVQIKVMPQNRLTGFAFIDDSNEDVEPI
jgi:hypothetical protein